MYDLVATNPNNSARTQMLTTGDQYHVITQPDITSCDVYTLQVTARNSAGSNTSATVLFSFPSLPYISPVKEYSLFKMGDRHALKANFVSMLDKQDYNF